MSVPAWTVIERGDRRRRRTTPINDPLIRWDEEPHGKAGLLPTASSRRSSDDSASRTGRALATLWARASGGNAVVIKIASFGSGPRSLKALTKYLTKEEKALDETGMPTDLDRLVQDWQDEFSDRAPSRDMMILRFEVATDDRDLVERLLVQALRTDFGRREDQVDQSRSGAYTIDAAGPDRLAVSFAVVLTGERITRYAPEQATHQLSGEGVHPVILAHITNRFAEQDFEVKFQGPPDTASGEKGMRQSLLQMHTKSKSGVAIATAARLEAKENGRNEYRRERWVVARPKGEAEIKLTATAIAKLTNSRQPRDFMHLIISGPKNVDKEQFIAAAQDWLKVQFPAHRYVTAVHNRAPNRAGEKPTHPHVHVALLLKDKTGRRLSHEKSDLENWRRRFAEKARERGIILNPERRTDRLAPPPVKRHEYNLVERLKNKAPAYLIDKIAAKTADQPTAPKRPDALAHAFNNEEALSAIIKVIEGLSRDAKRSITVRTAAKQVLPALTVQHQRLAQALGIDRAMPASHSSHSRRSPMKSDTPITPEMADKARANVARALWRGLETISDPAARADYVKGAAVVKDLIGTQLDIRSGQRGRTQAERAKENANALSSNRVAGPAIGPEVEPSYPSRQIASGLAPTDVSNRVTKTENDRTKPSGRVRKELPDVSTSAKRSPERDKVQKNPRERDTPQVLDPRTRSREDRERSR